MVITNRAMNTLSLLLGTSLLMAVGGTAGDDGDWECEWTQDDAGKWFAPYYPNDICFYQGGTYDPTPDNEPCKENQVRAYFAYGLKDDGNYKYFWDFCLGNGNGLEYCPDVDNPEGPQVLCDRDAPGQEQSYYVTLNEDQQMNIGEDISEYLFFGPATGDDAAGEFDLRVQLYEGDYCTGDYTEIQWNDELGWWHSLDEMMGKTVKCIFPYINYGAPRTELELWNRVGFKWTTFPLTDMQPYSEITCDGDSFQDIGLDDGYWPSKCASSDDEIWDLIPCPRGTELKDCPSVADSWVSEYVRTYKNTFDFDEANARAINNGRGEISNAGGDLDFAGATTGTVSQFDQYPLGSLHTGFMTAQSSEMGFMTQKDVCDNYNDYCFHMRFYVEDAEGGACRSGDMFQGDEQWEEFYDLSIPLSQMCDNGGGACYNTYNTDSGDGCINQQFVDSEGNPFTDWPMAVTCAHVVLAEC